jgi:hypothetical protein
VSVKIFISCVSKEFLTYRDQLRRDLTRHNVEVKVQEDFKDLGTLTLEKLDAYPLRKVAVTAPHTTPYTPPRDYLGFNRDGQRGGSSF